jgi:hypothetical protein
VSSPLAAVLTSDSRPVTVVAALGGSVWYADARRKARAGGRRLPAHAFRHGASRVFAQAASAGQGTPSKADSMMPASMPRSLRLEETRRAHVLVFDPFAALKMMSDFGSGSRRPMAFSASNSADLDPSLLLLSPVVISAQTATSASCDGHETRQEYSLSSCDGHVCNTSFPSSLPVGGLFLPAIRSQLQVLSIAHRTRLKSATGARPLHASIQLISRH